MLTSTRQPTNPITTAMRLPASTVAGTNEPTTVVRSTTTEEFASTAKSSATESHTTPRATPEPTKSTNEFRTEDTETTTEYLTAKSPTTTQTPITTNTPTTTKQPPTTLPPSTTPKATTAVTMPTTQSSTQDPHVCGRSDAKDILFIIDGTVNYRRYWVTSGREFKQLKHFLKEVISELKGDKFNIGVMQYGRRNEPEMEIDFWEGDDLAYQIDKIKQMGGEKRYTGATLAVASNKVSRSVPVMLG